MRATGRSRDPTERAAFARAGGGGAGCGGGGGGGGRKQKNAFGFISIYIYGVSVFFFEFDTPKHGRAFNSSRRHFRAQASFEKGFVDVEGNL
jgi:hypothetical protein